jgi:phosphate transport system substrate-binding protein
MKKSKTILSLTVIATAISFSAISQVKADQNYAYLTGTKFTYPLIEKWILEYKKVNPTARIKLLKKGENNTDSANISIVSHKLEETKLKQNDSYVQVAEYALLPIANEANPLVKTVVKKGIEEKQLKDIFFKTSHDELLSSEELAKKKEKNPYTVYTRATSSCASISFADHFVTKWENINGKGISGDDKHLLQAVLKDTNSISYNNLGYIYDLNTRLPVKGIVILPIDINQNGKLDKEEQIYGTLDQVITYLENNPDEKRIPTAYVNFIFDKSITNETLQLFLNWVLTDGQKYNHELGFFNYGPKVQAKQIKILQNVVAN